MNLFEQNKQRQVNNDKIYTEHHDEREEFEAMDPCTANDPYSITLRIKAEKINIEAIEEPKKQ